MSVMVGKRIARLMAGVDMAMNAVGAGTAGALGPSDQMTAAALTVGVPISVGRQIGRHSVGGAVDMTVDTAVAGWGGAWVVEAGADPTVMSPLT